MIILKHLYPHTICPEKRENSRNYTKETDVAVSLLCVYIRSYYVELHFQEWVGSKQVQLIHTHTQNNLLT